MNLICLAWQLNHERKIKQSVETKLVFLLHFLLDHLQQSFDSVE